MRKHFILLFIIFFAGVFFTAVNNYGPKACGTNAVACKATVKKDIKNHSAGQAETDEPPIYMLVNPLIQ